jgi:methylthioribose-1-phosphate isomerase
MRHRRDGTAIVRSLLELGRNVHVWLTEGAPSMEGSRVGSFQLTQMDVPHTVIPDTAVGWLLSSRETNAALLRGDTVCGNSDIVAPIGSLNVARLAIDAGVPVHVVAPSTAFDPDAPDGKSVTLDVHSPAELTAPTIDAANRSPAVVGYLLSPAADVVPAPLVTSFLSEAGPRPGGRS